MAPVVRGVRQLGSGALIPRGAVIVAFILGLARVAEAQETHRVASCNTYAPPESNCPSAALKPLEAELAGLGLSKAREGADLTQVSLKCSASTVVHNIAGVSVPEAVHSVSLVIITRHGAKLEQPVVIGAWKSLENFLAENDYSVRIIPEPGPSYGIVQPSEDRVASITEPRIVRCLSKGSNVEVRRGAFTYKYEAGSDGVGVLHVPSDRKLTFELKTTKSHWPEGPVVRLCIGLLAEDCSLPAAADELLLNGEFETTEESPAASLENISWADVSPESVVVKAGLPWRKTWKIPASWSPHTAAVLHVGQVSVATVPLEQDVPSWSPLVIMLPDKWQAIIRDTYPNSSRFGLVMLAMLVCAAAALTWFKGNWSDLLKRLVAPPAPPRGPESNAPPRRKRPSKKRRH